MQKSSKQLSILDLTLEQRQSISQIAKEMQKTCYRRCQQKLLETPENLEIVTTQTIATLKQTQTDVQIYKEYYDRNVDFNVDNYAIQRCERNFRSEIKRGMTTPQRGFINQIGRDGKCVRNQIQNKLPERRLKMIVSGESLKGQNVLQPWLKYENK
ncbi:hypothetical protein SS50377_22413 [Spironucleus salmonicida]|uniref:Uncharacterized protein n=1 Tax=Spironucleus salmonicida TaxID=348837 RepID=V6LMZ9_9EUKA|nr:hypothetical protein SS50377_22413 [Spironucleus salmonicida]|eukprot:EST42094.1 Hypothetical protein SS50377_18403 [Spironucleus salmonicida]